MKTVNCKVLPRTPDLNTIYRLMPAGFKQGFYDERTNRNEGWLSRNYHGFDEQKLLYDSTVAIAGCGGMGGEIAQRLLRTGIGTIKIADSEVFDISNIQRQFGAGRKTIGEYKAFATAIALREITRDTIIEVYPQGINEETVEQFTDKCDLIGDEIELFELIARILLHIVARIKTPALLMCPTVGHETYLTKFTAHSMTIEDVLGIGYEQAKRLKERVQKGDSAARVEFSLIMERMVAFVAPRIPEYSSDTSLYSTVEEVKKFISIGRAPIIATNPGSAAGFITNQILFELLKKSPIQRNFVTAPTMPGYLTRDDANAKMVQGIWWPTI